MTFEDVRAFVLSLPGTEERPSYGTPGLFVRKTFLARLKEDGILVLKVGLPEKELLMETAPETFHQTDHYKGWPAVLVRLEAADQEHLRGLLLAAWRRATPKRLVRQYEWRTPG